MKDTKDDAPAGPVAGYEPPAVEWEEWLDVRATLVMVCAKVNPIEGPPCDQGFASS